jgi:hypothetical protein
MIFRVYKPDVFRGSLRKRNYFEGWYFKHVSSDLKNVVTFIPGISLNNSDPHAFIQIINGITGESDYIPYSLSEFDFSRNSLYIKIGKSVFTDTFSAPDIDRGQFRISGKISYGNMIRYPNKLFSPGIMGWYSFVPSMECKHGIVSVNHNLSGRLISDYRLIDFTNGKGYIEKDWGTSFPETWLWIQANNFEDRETSFSFSVAKIPWRGKYFLGFISYLYYNRKFYNFSTYNGSKIELMRNHEDSVFLILRNKNHILKLSATKSFSGILNAPASGEMIRRIKESNDSNVSIALFNSQNEVIYTDMSQRAGIEIIETIFDYFTDENTSYGEKRKEYSSHHASAPVSYGG